jgi:hypothetical protein|tara:strand:+ start:3651 stop:6341 length:2691 start_codon:yes stop_codon:yes gene_type:complete
MKTKQFLDLVLGHKGNYCVFAVNADADKKKQKFYTSVDHVIDAARDFDSNGYDAYFSLATLEEAGSRKADNVQSFRSFFLDLDCGEGDNKFASQAVAVKALQKFCKQHKLPKPTLVNSGRGVHVYWILDAPVGKDDWLTTALRLKKLCATSDFPADPAVTADLARVLRVPSTHNYKSDPPALVSFFGLEEPRTTDYDTFSELVGGEPIPVPSKVKQGAAVLRELLEHDTYEKPAEVGEGGRNPAMLSYIGHLRAKGHLSEDDIQAMAHGFNAITFDPPLDKEEVDGLVARYAVHEEVDFYEDDDVDASTDPIDATSKHVIPTFPRPYFRGHNGGVYIRKTNSDGEPDEDCIYHYDFYVTRRLHDVLLGEVISFALHLPRDGVREFVIPLTAVTSREDFRKHMAMQGITSFGKDVDRLMAYTAAWINELQRTTTASEAHQQFGWTDKNMNAFVLGDQLVTARDVEYNPPSGKTAGLIDFFKAEGTRERQLEVLDFFNRSGLELQQFAVCMGFGSILMPLTGLNSFGVHLFGGTGVGKTTAMYGNTGIWGDPHALTLGQRDTPNSRMNRGEVMCNLPLNSDEMTNMKGGDVSEYSYQVAEGKQKNRMAGGGNIERVRGKPWQLMALSTGNMSFYEEMQRIKDDPKAEMQRVLEIRVDKNLKATLDKSKTDALFQDSKENYGHLAVGYIQYVINNRDDLRELYNKVKSKIDAKAGLQAENRFWSGGCAATIVAALAAKQLGFINYDINKLYSWVVDELKKVKAYVDDSAASVEQLVTEFATENWTNILKIKSSKTMNNGGQPIDGMVPIVIPEQNPRNMFVARFETDTNMFYIVPKAFKKHLNDRHINYAATVEEMVKQMGAKKLQIRLTRGTNFNLPPIRVIAVKLGALNSVSETSET